MWTADMTSIEDQTATLMIWVPNNIVNWISNGILEPGYCRHGQPRNLFRPYMLKADLTSIEEVQSDPDVSHPNNIVNWIYMVDKKKVPTY